MPTKPKRVQYRKATFLHPNKNLQHLLSAALRKFAQVHGRQQVTSPGGSEYRLINAHTSQLGMVFGDYFTYEAGTNKLLVHVDTAATSLNVKQIAPPQTDPRRRNEFLDDLLLFGVFNNHVVLMQSQAWQGRAFEGYLNWLLNEAGLMTGSDYVELSDVPPVEFRKRAANNDIKSISFRAPVMEVGEGTEGVAHEQAVVANRKIGADVIRSILGDDDFERLHLDRAAGGNLRVDLKITFDRSTTDAGQRALNGIARALRHIDLDDDEIRLEIPGIGSVKGSELKLTQVIQVEAHNGIVSPNDAFPKMASWILDLIQNRLVENG